MNRGVCQWLWPPVLIALVFAASGRPSLAAPDPGFSYDKAAHFLVFGLIATSVARIGLVHRFGWRGAVLAAVLVSAYGAVDEFRQSLTPGRSVEFADWMADTAGAFLAAFLYQGWARYRGFLEWRLGRRGRAKSGDSRTGGAGASRGQLRRDRPAG